TWSSSPARTCRPTGRSDSPTPPWPTIWPSRPPNTPRTEPNVRLPGLALGGADRPVRPAAGSAPPGLRAPPASVVEGDVPDRGGLLLHSWLPAGHRRPGRRGAVAGRDHPAGAADPVRGPADLPPGRGREPARRGLDRYAGAAAAVVAGQALRPGPARLCGHRLHHHHHPLGRRRHHPCPGEPAGPGLPRGPPARGD